MSTADQQILNPPSSNNQKWTARKKALVFGGGMVLLSVVAAIIAIPIILRNKSDADPAIRQWSKWLEETCQASTSLGPADVTQAQNLIATHPQLVNLIYFPGCTKGLLSQAVTKNNTDFLNWLLKQPFIDPSLLVVDGSFNTALSLSEKVKWGAPFAEAIKAKTKEIEKNKKTFAPFYQILNDFPAIFQKLPPILVLGVATRINAVSMNLDKNKNNNFKSGRFKHWLQLLHYYRKTNGLANGMELSDALSTSDVRSLVVHIAETLMGGTRRAGADGKWASPSGDTQGFFVASEFGSKEWAEKTMAKHLSAAASMLALLNEQTLKDKRSKWRESFAGEVREKDLNLESIWLYTGSNDTDEGKGIFGSLNRVMAKQGDTSFIPTAYDKTFFPWSLQLEIAIFSSFTLGFKCDKNECLLYRGIMQAPKQTESYYANGNKVILSSFTSTSKTPDRAMQVLCLKTDLEKSDILIVISLQKNVMESRHFWPIDIESISQHPEEKEVLFPMGAHFRVTKTEKMICEKNAERRYLKVAMTLTDWT